MHNRKIKGHPNNVDPVRPENILSLPLLLLLLLLLLLFKSDLRKFFKTYNVTTQSHALKSRNITVSYLLNEA